MKHDIFELKVKWLEGGREDTFLILAEMPLNVQTVAEAIRSYQGGDGSTIKMADALEDAVRVPHVNDAYRFVGINGLIDNEPVTVELQSMPFVAIGIEFDHNSASHVVDLGTRKRIREVTHEGR